MALLAEGAIAAGHQVTVVTITKGPGAVTSGVPVVRTPSFWRWALLVFRADAVVLGGLSLRGLIVPFLLRKPVLVSHQTWYWDRNRKPGLNGRLKRWASRFTRNVCASQALADALGVRCTVIPDAYRSRIFPPKTESARDLDVVFVGRLVPDKGADILIRAAKILERRGLHPTITLIGDGDRRRTLEDLCAKLDFRNRPSFLGWKDPEEIASLLSRHRVLVVPSRWEEPFGIVALEGIACGCAVVASRGGGLPEAVGPCGLFFANGSAIELAETLQEVLTDDRRRAELVANAASHLPRFREEAFVQAYLAILISLMPSRKTAARGGRRA